MRILGIDVGTQIAGYSVIEIAGGKLKPLTYGAIKATSKKLSFPERLKKIYDGLTIVIQEYKPTEAVVEELFYGKNIKSAIKIGEGRGIAILCAANANIPVTEYAATVVKKSVTGLGNATKMQVQEMVKNILGLSEIPEPADAADAIAIAICHCHRIR
ncbi:MAG: crossover junction endodeoxyribonuclease RuvC [Candidatus Anammoxibacter sp.]